MLETRYCEGDPRGNNGQYHLLFLQVFGHNAVSGKSKDPTGLLGFPGLEGLDLLTLTIQFDFEGQVRPASRDGMDTTVVQSKADEQVFDVPGCYDWVLNDLAVLLLLKRMREKVRQLF